MKTWKLLWLLLIPAAGIVRMARPGAPAPPPPVDAEQSAGVFVGVSSFDDSSLQRVPYAVEDAVDLAHQISLEGKRRLLRPDQIVLVLSGEPRTRDSKDRLEELREAGAAVRAATRADILDALQRQAAKVGEQGIFIATFATHGYSSEGVHYVLGKDSHLGDAQTAISTTGVLDAASRKSRSLLFIDACRERMTAATRSVAPPPNTAAPHVPEINRQVAFFAATAGGYAYDCDRNGCFTAAVLDGLRGKAERNARGAITVGTLQKYVMRRLKRHRPPEGIQLNCDDDLREMELAKGAPPGGPNPVAVKHPGTAVRALDKQNAQLWEKNLHVGILDAAVTDLDGDKRNEVITSIASGRIVALDALGDELWSRDTGEPAKMVIDTLRKTKRETVAWMRGTLTILDHRGKVVSSYTQDDPIQQVIFGRQTAQYPPRIIGRTSTSVFALNPRSGAEHWYGSTPREIRRIDTIDYDNDGNTEIRVTTASGEVSYLDFDGKVIQGRLPFTLISPKQRTMRSRAAAVARSQ